MTVAGILALLGAYWIGIPILGFALSCLIIYIVGRIMFAIVKSLCTGPGIFFILAGAFVLYIVAASK